MATTPGMSPSQHSRRCDIAAAQSFALKAPEGVFPSGQDQVTVLAGGCPIRASIADAGHHFNNAKNAA